MASLESSEFYVVFKKNGRTSSPIKHEIFDFYSKIADMLSDDKWIEIFKTLSRGEGYKNVKFNGSLLIIKKKGKTKTLEINSSSNMQIKDVTDSEIESYNKCKKFLKNILSEFKEENEQVEFSIKREQITEDDEEDEDDIVNKFILGAKNQTTFISDFAVRMRVKHKFSTDECSKLISTISFLFVQKRLTPKSIFLNEKKGKIVRIKGIIFYEGGYKFDKSLIKDFKPKKIKITRKEDIFRSSLILTKIETKKIKICLNN